MSSGYSHYYYERRQRSRRNPYEEYSGSDDDDDEIVYLGSIATYTSSGGPLDHCNYYHDRNNSASSRKEEEIDNNSSYTTTSSSLFETTQDVEALLMRTRNASSRTNKVNGATTTSKRSQPPRLSDSNEEDNMSTTTTSHDYPSHHRRQRNDDDDNNLIIIPNSRTGSSDRSFADSSTTSNDMFCHSYTIDLAADSLGTFSSSIQVLLDDHDDSPKKDCNQARSTQFGQKQSKNNKKQHNIVKQLQELSHWRTKRRIIQNENVLSHISPRTTGGGTVVTKKEKSPLPSANDTKGGFNNKTHVNPQQGRDDDEEDDDHLCVICQDQTRDCVLLPCRHLCACRTCASNDQILTCPICREHVDAILKVYM